MEKKTLLSLILEVQQEVTSVTKNATNPYFKSRYADYSSVQDATFEPLNKRGILVVQPTVVIDGRNYVNTRLILAETGETLESFTEIVFKDGDAQAQGSGITYARRYGLMSLLALAAEDDDANLATGKDNKKPTQAQKPQPAAASAPASDPTKPVIKENNELWNKAISYCIVHNQPASALCGSYTIDGGTLKKLQSAIDSRKNL